MKAIKNGRPCIAEVRGTQGCLRIKLYLFLGDLWINESWILSWLLALSRATILNPFIMYIFIYAQTDM